MGKLLDKLRAVGQTGGSGIGFLGARGPARKPRPAAIFVRLDTTDTAVAEAALANGADGLILSGWTQTTGLGQMKSVLSGSDAKEAVWGADLGTAAGARKEQLQELADAGAAFAMLDSSAAARLLFADVEKLDLVSAVEIPSSELGLLLVRGQSLLPVQVGLLVPEMGAGELARLSVAEYVRLRLVVESLRFPTLLALNAPPAEDDVTTLVHLGIDGVVLPGQAANPQQLGAQVKALRETLEKTPTPKEDRENVLLAGLMPSPRQGEAPGQPEREPEHE